MAKITLKDIKEWKEQRSPIRWQGEIYRVTEGAKGQYFIVADRPVITSRAFYHKGHGIYGINKN